jgi:WD40 repeat protein
VQAGPPSTAYRLRKHLWRNRAAVSAIGAIVILLIAGMSASITQAMRARRAEQTVAAQLGDVRSQRNQAIESNGRAEAEAAKLRRELSEHSVDQGIASWDQGRPAIAMLWFANALRYDIGDPDRERLQRCRIRASLDHCPRLVDLHPTRFSRDDYERGSFDAGTFDGSLEYSSGISVTGSEGWSLKLVVDGKSVQIIDSRIGRPIRLQVDGPAKVLSAGFSRDQTRVVTTSSSFARVWDARTGDPVTPPMAHDDAVRTAFFSADDRYVFTDSADGTVRVWDASTGIAVTPPIPHHGGGGDVHPRLYVPALARVVTAGPDGTAHVSDSNTGKPVAPPLAHGGRVEHVAFSPDGTRIATTSTDEVRVWDANTGAPLMPAMEHGGQSSGAVFSRNGEFLRTDERGGGRLTWDVRAAPAIGQHKAVLSSVKFSRNGRYVVTASDDMTARVWDAETGAAVTPPMGHDGEVGFAEFSPDGNYVVTTSADKTARVWRSADGTPVAPPMLHDGTVAHATFSPDGRYVATASYDHTARVWDASTGRAITPPMRHEGPVLDAAFSPDGASVVTASYDQTAQVWGAMSGKPTAPPMKHAAPSGSGGGTVTILRREGLSVRKLTAVPATPTAPLQPMRRASFSPDGRYVLTAGHHGAAQVWDASTGQPVAPPMLHGHAIEDAEFSPDGKSVVTAAQGDKNARLWNAGDGRPFGTPMGHRDTVRHAAFSADGLYVVTASADGTARVWDARSGKPVTPPLEHPSGVEYAAFDPSGNYVVTACRDGRARRWTIQPVRLTLEQSAQVAELLSARRINEAGGLVRISGRERMELWDVLRQAMPDFFRPGIITPAAPMRPTSPATGPN